MCDKCENLSDESNEMDPNLPLILIPPLEMSTENLAEDVMFDKDEFNKGINEASYYGGFYTALINAGVAVEDCIVLISNKLNVDMNLQIAKINANANIEVSKNVSLSKEKELL